jgi:DNA-binding SARP family transcriptional activator
MDDHDRTQAIHAMKPTLRLLGGFGLTAGQRHVALPPSAQRVLAAIALRPNVGDRMMLGTMLYPEGRKNRISASLRSALWRAKREVGVTLVESHGQRLHLAENVEVDLHLWTQRARMLTSRPTGEPANDIAANDIEALSQELLPSWGEEWLQLDQQRWDQLRLHALEWLAEHFALAGRYVEALDAGLAAVSIEPYRESAHRALITAFLAEGNRASAVAQYHRYQRLVRHELGLRPTPQLQELVHDLTGASDAVSASRHVR